MAIKQVTGKAARAPSKVLGRLVKDFSEKIAEQQKSKTKEEGRFMEGKLWFSWPTNVK